MLDFVFSTEFLISSIAYAMPIVFAALAALISKKAGTLNINIEGSMSVAALAGALVSSFTESWFFGLLAAIIAGIAMSLILGFCSMVIKTDSVLSGIALNTLASGLSVVILFAILGVRGDSSSAPSTMIPAINIQGISDLPVVGKLLFGENLLVYVGILSVVLLGFLLNHTRLGSHIKAVGYNDEAARAAGIKVNRTRYIALIFCGVFAGIGGAFLSMVNLSYYSVGMVAGRGFIGIAAEAMGSGNPFSILFFAWLFGAVDYFAIGAQSVLEVPYELLNTLPYLMTVIALVIFSLQMNRKNE
ncbi:MAG: ABC transporter permease [Anaerolineaceae bacterium]